LSRDRPIAPDFVANALARSPTSKGVRPDDAGRSNSNPRVRKSPLVGADRWQG